MVDAVDAMWTTGYVKWGRSNVRRFELRRVDNTIINIDSNTDVSQQDRVITNQLNIL